MFERMTAVFYISSVVALMATAMVITRKNPVHALLYFIVSLLAVAVDFFLLGAPFVAALEVIIYAGAIMVLFIFVIMTLNVSSEKSALFDRGAWAGPALLAFVLLVELAYIIARAAGDTAGGVSIPPADVGRALYGPYLVAVELASLLLLAGLVGAYHLGRREERCADEGGKP
jgi:NADH-quinone oxidoreductase subunit J